MHSSGATLRIFLAIAREGTLGAAARRLDLSHPTMGRRLRALEEDVGHTLMQHTGEGLVLTDEGTMLLAHAERIEAEAISLERQPSASRRSRRPTSSRGGSCGSSTAST